MYFLQSAPSHQDTERELYHWSICKCNGGRCCGVFIILIESNQAFEISTPIHTEPGSVLPYPAGTAVSDLGLANLLGPFPEPVESFWVCYACICLYVVTRENLFDSEFDPKENTLV